MRHFLYLVLVVAFISCSKKAEVTWDTALYSDAELTKKIADVKKGTVGTASEFMNHKRIAKNSIKININGKEGFIPPQHVVINQDPAKSVYKWGYNEKYEKFFSPKDKKHYKEGFDFPDLAKLPTKQIPLEDLVKDSIVE